jgi:hypothetical protein
LELQGSVISLFCMYNIWKVLRLILVSYRRRLHKFTTCVLSICLGFFYNKICLKYSKEMCFQSVVNRHSWILKRGARVHNTSINGCPLAEIYKSQFCIILIFKHKYGNVYTKSLSSDVYSIYKFTRQIF